MKKSKKSIEIEKRGKLTPAKKKYLLKLLNKKGKFVGEYNQLSVFIESNNSITGNIENTKASIAIAVQKNLKTGKTKCELKAKVGKMESGSRKEIAIPFSLNNLNPILDLLEVFGISEGCPRYYHRLDYSLDSYFISIKEKGLAPDHFEIEVAVDSIKKVDNEEIKMNKWLKDQNLKPFTEKEYKTLMIAIFHNNPPVKLDTIDYKIVEK